jgi:hypothetical protein
MTTRYLEQSIIKVLAVMPDLTSADLAAKVDAPLNSVKNTLCFMIDRSLVSKQRYGKAWVWRLYEKPEGENTGKPERINKMAGTYDGKELRRNPGIPDERYAAFNLPSLMGGERVTPRRTA